MKASWEKTGSNEGVLTVEVEAEQVATALDKAFIKVIKNVTVPGFRKGKVPRKIFEMRFGVEALYQDAVEILLPEAYEQAVEESGIDPVAQPGIDIEQIEQGQPFVFKATVTVKPEVNLGEYKGLVIPVKDFSVKPEEVDERLAQMRERHASLEPLAEGDAVASGDRVQINFEGFINGEPFEGGKGEKHTLEIGSGSFIPGFEDQLIGMKVGESKEIHVTFPEDYQAEDLQGQEATFQVEILDAKHKVLPDLDDEFAKDVSEFETLDQLKDDIQSKLAHEKEHEEEHYLQDTALELASANAEVEIPDVMVEHETDHMLQDYARQLQMQGLNLDFYYQVTGTDEETLKAQFRESAYKKVKNGLVLETIAEAEGIEATEEELEQEVASMAERYNQTVDSIREIMSSGNSLDSLKNDLRIRKTLKLLVEQSEKGEAVDEAPESASTAASQE